MTDTSGFEDYEEPQADEIEEHLAYSSPDWDGELADGAIMDEGTRGWCVTRAGEAIIHIDEPIVLHTVIRPKRAIFLRMVDTVISGVLPQN